MHDRATAQPSSVASDLPADAIESPLYNADLAPVPPERRTWSTYNFTALWISMAHCIPTYMLAADLIVAGMNWWQALLTIALANLIVLVPILLNAHAGTKYGIPFPVLARASFGTSGANVPALLRAIVACGWFGIQTWIGGQAVRIFVVALWPSFAELEWGSAATFLVFWALNVWIIWRGMEAVRVFENWAAPIVLVMALWLFVWIVRRAGGFGPMLDQPSRFATLGEFWPVFVPWLTGMIGFWSTLSLNIPDFTRFGRGQKQQMVGQALGLPTTMVAFSALGVAITSASQVVLSGVPVAELWKPEMLLGYMTSSAPPPGATEPLIASAATRVIVAVVALLGIGIATISVNIAANVVSPANDFANFAPRLISFRTGGLVTGVLGIAMMPWKLLESAGSYVFAWLIGYSALLGPIAGIMIADYWIVRRRELDLADLYRPNGRYGGVNPIAIVALCLGVAPNVPGFLQQAGVVDAVPAFLASVYAYAWFVGFGIAAATYVVGTRLVRAR